MQARVLSQLRAGQVRCRADLDFRLSQSSFFYSGHLPPRLPASSSSGKKLPPKCPPSSDKMGSQTERAGGGAPCPSFSPPNSSSPNSWQNKKSPLAFCSCPPTPSSSKELSSHFRPFYPAYPFFLPAPYLVTCGSLPSMPCPPRFKLPQDTPYTTMAVPSLLINVNEPEHPSTWGETLRPYPGACQDSGQTQPSQSQNLGLATARTYSTGPEQAGRVAAGKRAPLGSQAGSAALPYPLKKENGKILYECNVCSKSFGQLSNLKVSASGPPRFPLGILW